MCAHKFLQGKTSALPRNYDVFLSFRGPDTRTGFTNFLYNSLVAAGVHVFRDDNALPVGEQIVTELLRAIRTCRIAIPIISEQYAQSKWCLRELTEIMHCHRKHGTSVFPVFYKVNVFDLNRQGGYFVEALRKHERQCSLGEVKEWREALTAVARIGGWITSSIASGYVCIYVCIHVCMCLRIHSSISVTNLSPEPCDLDGNGQSGIIELGEGWNQTVYLTLVMNIYMWAGMKERS